VRWALSKDFLRRLTATLVLSVSIAVGSALMGSALMGSEAAAAPISPAPKLPTLPDVPKTLSARDHAIGIPAAASVASGTWVLGNGERMPLARTVVMLPAAAGTPLLADWNGDGLATPGRYEDGRWFVTNATVGAHQWQSLATFGKAGELPVTGDVDGDGRLDLGTFRSGQWSWKLSGGGTRSETFGDVGDLPVVGDWDGDGQDDAGVWRGGTWILRVFRVTGDKVRYAGPGVQVQRISGTDAALLTFSLGTRKDLPVVGDWDGNGRTDPGFIRGGSRWMLSSGLRNVQRTTEVGFVVSSGFSPLVGSVPTPRGSCPTATVQALDRGAELAAQVQLPQRVRGAIGIPGMREVRATVQDGVRYVMTNDLLTRLRNRVTMPYYDSLATAKTVEESIRRPANAAQAAAIIATTSDWNRVNGISRSQLVDYARWHVRSIACQHGANTPGGWGNSFQSALWATVTGQAAWMLWADLTPGERALVASMVAAEADAVVKRGPLYFRDRVGKEGTPGDSRADENSWNLLAPALALAMMPDDPRAGQWRASLASIAIAAFARPSDLRSTAVVNGVTLGKSLPGTNANEDGTVTNHGIVNPDYTQNVQHLWWAASLLRSGRQVVPAALFLNADIVYRALAVVQFPSPPYAAPGGTVYKPLGVIYYPMGVGWGVRRPATFTGVDGFANIYAAADAKAGEFLAAHARDARALQLRFNDGRMYQSGTSEESYRLGKEEYALSQMALAWWAGAIKKGPSMTVTNEAIPGMSLAPR